MVAQLHWITKWLDASGQRKLGPISSEPNQGILLDKLLNSQLRIPQPGFLLSEALHCWQGCTKWLKTNLLCAPELQVVGLPHGEPQSFFTAGQLTAWTNAGVVTMSNCFQACTRIPLVDLTTTHGLPPHI